MAKKSAAPKSVEELVQHALKVAATNPKAKWSGASAAALFNTKEANHAAAIAECLSGERPLLAQTKTGGALTAAGFGRIAGELAAQDARTTYDQLRDGLSDDQVGGVARAMAERLNPTERVEFIQGVIRRTPLAATELTPLLEEAIAAEKAGHETRIAAAAKRHADEEVAKKALARALELFDERRQNRLDALRREWQAEGENAAEFQVVERKKTGTGGGTAPEPRTAEDVDFRRYETDRLAAAWRDAWESKKHEGRDYLESAMWNIRGLRMVGEVGACVKFDGRYHESDSPVFTDDPVRIVRPGWLLKEDEGDYVALKAAVEKA